MIDTVWTPHGSDFVENLKKEINLKKIDFIAADHGESVKIWQAFLPW